MRYAEKQKAFNLGLCAALIEAGRPVDHAKKVTNLTMADLCRYGIVYEVVIPDPRGYSEDAEGNRVHNGQVTRTGMWRPTAGEYTPPKRISNKELKRRDRKKFFDSRRARKRQEVVHAA